MLANLSRRTRSTVLGIAIIAPLAACKDAPLAEDPAAFVGELRTLNVAVTGRIEGTVSFTVEDGVFTAKVKASGFDPVVHRQYVREGGRCPTDTRTADTNRDDLVDGIEGRASYGPILLPLDSQLTDLTPGPEGGDFPFGAVIEYAQVADFDDLVGALRAFESPDPSRVVGLGENERLDLGRRTVVVYGVAEDLPGTVRPDEDLPATLALPVACAVLQRVE